MHDNQITARRAYQANSHIAIFEVGSNSVVPLFLLKVPKIFVEPWRWLVRQFNLLIILKKMHSRRIKSLFLHFLRLYWMVY